MNKIIRFIPYCLIALTLSLVVIPTSARRDPPNGAQKDSTVVVGEVSQAKVQDTQISTRLRRYDIVRLDRAAASQIRRNGKLLLNTSFGSFNLDLQPHDLRAPDYGSQWIDSEGVAHQLPKEPITTFKGTLLGMPGQARMTVTETDVEGVLIAGNERYFIEPARKLSKTRSADEFIFYRATDLIPDPGTCGVTLADEIAAEEERARTHIADEQTPKSLVIPGVSPVRIVRLATDADAEFVAAFGGAAAANTQIMNIMNQVDGIYQVEMGVGFQIVFQNAWADAGTQPYNTLLPSDLLTQFRNHWNANFGSVSRNLTHLWTGKDLNGGTIGIAYLGVVCQSSTFSYGLSQRFPSAGGITVQTVSLTAHEIGHNFSARHTNQPGSELPRDVEIGCQSTIMEASIGSGSAFCPYSQSQIIGHASNASCLLDSGNPPPSTTPCTETPIAGPVNATLDASDCRSPARGVGFFADRFSFNATAGDQITITMTRSGTSLDPYLFLIGPTGMVLIQNDDSGGGQNSRIPSSSELTLPHTGKYIIEATSFAMNQTGGYTVALTFNGCRLSVSPSSIQVSAAGGPGSINVGNCGSYQLRGYSTGNWLIESITGGSGTQTLNYSVQPNPNAAGRTGFLVVGGDNSVGGLRIPVHQSGSGPDCTTGTIGFGQTINGSIVPGDCHSPVRGNNYFSKRYSFTATEGQQAAITLTGGFDTFLTLIGPDGAVLLNDDDSGGGTSSRIPGGPGFFRLGVTGTYVIEVNGFSAGTTGPFTLTLTGAQSAAQLGSSTYNVNENVGSVNVTVNRSGDLTTAAAVDFSTTGSGFQACNVLNGAAVQNCDYIVGAGTINFAPGETSKNVTLLITDDLYAEGNESFSLGLSNPVGIALGSQTSSTIVINDNDAGSPTTNLIDNAQAFVREHYYDFLSRSPDTDGLTYWTGQITQCGTDAACIRNKRLDVSNAFFYEAEYQQTGAYVFRLYRAAFGDNQPSPNPDSSNVNEARKLPSYAAFVPDRARVVASANLAQSQLNLASILVQRPEFTARYPLSLNGPQFVDAVLNNIRTSGTELGSQQSVLVNLFNQGGRAAVMFRLAEDTLANPVNNRPFIDNEYNRAFVFTQYAGYLRRDSDMGGFLFWLNLVNGVPVRDPTMQRAMVCAFLTSAEYQQRFSPVVTRTNAECGN